MECRDSNRTSPKKVLLIHLFALKIIPEELIMDVNTYRLLFENLVDRDLSIYIESLDGRLNHYRDKYGLKVIHLGNEKYALVETKTSIRGCD